MADGTLDAFLVADPRLGVATVEPHSGAAFGWIAISMTAMTISWMPRGCGYDKAVRRRFRGGGIIGR